MAEGDQTGNYRKTDDRYCTNCQQVVSPKRRLSYFGLFGTVIVSMMFFTFVSASLIFGFILGGLCGYLGYNGYSRSMDEPTCPLCNAQDLEHPETQNSVTGRRQQHSDEEWNWTE
jgi:hypothetical protein